MSNRTSSPEKAQIPVDGAFEFFEDTREELITLTREGKLLRVGEYLPSILGIELNTGPSGKAIILHSVNALGTETCDVCTSKLETFHKENPDVSVFTLTKQASDEIAKNDTNTDQVTTHNRVSIDHETAIDLGIALEPGENADKEFWPTALRRSVIVAKADGMITHIQHPDDQEQMPDFTAAFQAAKSAK